MIIVCDKCNTKYFLDPQLLLPNGKNVKCVQCGYIWFEKNDDHIESANIELEPIPHGASLPVIVKLKSSLWIRLLPTILSLMIIFSAAMLYRGSIVNHLPVTSYIYDSLGFTTINGLRFEKIELLRGDSFLNINGEILNGSKSSRVMPNVIFTVTDEYGNKLSETIIRSSGSKIAPGDSLPIHKRIFALPQGAKRLVVDMSDFLQY